MTGIRELPPDLALPTAYAAQAACATAIGLLLVHFYSRYRRGYLFDWYGSWFALLVYHAAAGLDLYLAPTAPSSNAIRAVCIVLATIGALLQPLWFFAGAFELANLRPFRLERVRKLALVLAAAGALGGVVLTRVSHDASHLTAILVLHSLLLAVAVVAGGFYVHRRRAVAIFNVFLGVCLANGAVQLVILLLALLWRAGRLANPYPMPLGIVELVLQLALGLAMLIALLEDEREASLIAASQAEHLAYHDGLTGLPNRALFFDRLVHALEHAHRTSSRLALVFLDLDHFKSVNDSLGHSSGDTMLRAAASRIRQAVRAEDTVARFGGDEFVVLLQDVHRDDDPVIVTRKILDAVRKPYHVGPREVTATASAGITFYPDDGTNAEVLVRNADTAMYRAKDRGRDRYELYTAAMNAQAMELLELENALRRAQREGELMIYYQPLFDVERNRIYGMEALLRWNHPQLGILNPSRFIPIAEASGLIVPIGRWVLLEACKQARRWHDDWKLELLVSVNLSARQFQHPELVADIVAALDEAALPARFLELEVTESVAVQDVDLTARTLHELKALGVRISIDDFGTGYSSLSYLKQFPVDTVKLDRSFVRDVTTPQDAAIVSSVIAMAHGLSMKVMAEGVENEEQLDFLKAHRCDRLQGFFYSVPLSNNSLERFIDENRWLFREK